MGMFQILGRLANERGRECEKRAVEAFKESKELPAWFISIRPASKKQDHRGIDIVISSDVGDIFIQVKSSLAGARKFRREQQKGKYKAIEPVIINDEDTDDDIREKVISSASKLRLGFIDKKKRGPVRADIFKPIARDPAENDPDPNYGL